VIEEFGPWGISNALTGHSVIRAEAQTDPDAGPVVKVWITFTDPAVLELEATVVDAEPLLQARLHRRGSGSDPL
jgi:hypothetical protein